MSQVETLRKLVQVGSRARDGRGRETWTCHALVGWPTSAGIAQHLASKPSGARARPAEPGRPARAGDMPRWRHGQSDERRSPAEEAEVGQEQAKSPAAPSPAAWLGGRAEDSRGDPAAARDAAPGPPKKRWSLSKLPVLPDQGDAETMAPEASTPAAPGGGGSGEREGGRRPYHYYYYYYYYYHYYSYKYYYYYY